MRARLLTPLLLAGALLSSAASAEGLCERKDFDLIWTGCGTDARIELRLLPEEAGTTPKGALDVTGGYTAVNKREGGKPRPVGLFIHKGDILIREYARFDGVLLIDADGQARIMHRRRVSFQGLDYDLNDASRRSAFLSDVAEADGSLLQSHLLVVDGAGDVRATEGAPRFRRRILFQMPNGDLGLYDSTPRPLTLAEATAEVVARYQPVMALNLDMGSYDYCRRGANPCGPFTLETTAKLSNLLRFRLHVPE